MARVPKQGLGAAETRQRGRNTSGLDSRLIATVPDLSTPVQGTGYDYLNVTGTVTLGGNFTFHMMPGAENSFAAGDSLTLVSSSALTGTFLNLPHGTRLFASHGTGSFVINYTSTSVVLNQFLPVPEPSTWALMITGLGVVIFATLKRRR